MLWVLFGVSRAPSAPGGKVWRSDGSGRHVALTLDEQLVRPAVAHGALWVESSSGLLLRSENGGDAWEVFDGVAPLLDAALDAPLKCTATGCDAPEDFRPDQWFVTTDGRVAVIEGGKPVPRSLPDGDVPVGVFGAGEGHAVATGHGRNLYVTQDNGQHWRRVAYSASPARGSTRAGSSSPGSRSWRCAGPSRGRFIPACRICSSPTGR